MSLQSRSHIEGMVKRVEQMLEPPREGLTEAEVVRLYGMLDGLLFALGKFDPRNA